MPKEPPVTSAVEVEKSSSGKLILNMRGAGSENNIEVVYLGDGDWKARHGADART